MTIIRVSKNEKYAVISNVPLNDARLSWEARGVLAWLLSKPNDWEVSAAAIVNAGPAGEHKVRRILRELEGAGYLVRQRVRGEDGRFFWVSVVHEEPRKPSAAPAVTAMPQEREQNINLSETMWRFSTTGNSTTGNSTTGKPSDLISTEGLSTELKNKKEANGKNAIPFAASASDGHSSSSNDGHSSSSNDDNGREQEQREDGRAPAHAASSGDGDAEKARALLLAMGADEGALEERPEEEDASARARRRVANALVRGMAQAVSDPVARYRDWFLESTWPLAEAFIRAFDAPRNRKEALGWQGAFDEMLRMGADPEDVRRAVVAMIEDGMTISGPHAILSRLRTMMAAKRLGVSGKPKHGRRREQDAPKRPAPPSAHEVLRAILGDGAKTP